MSSRLRARGQARRQARRVRECFLDGRDDQLGVGTLFEVARRSEREHLLGDRGAGEAREDDDLRARCDAPKLGYRFEAADGSASRGRARSRPAGAVSPRQWLRCRRPLRRRLADAGLVSTISPTQRAHRLVVVADQHSGRRVARRGRSVAHSYVGAESRIRSRSGTPCRPSSSSDLLTIARVFSRASSSASRDSSRPVELEREVGDRE